MAEMSIIISRECVTECKYYGKWREFYYAKLRKMCLMVTDSTLTIFHAWQYVLG